MKVRIMKLGNDMKHYEKDINNGLFFVKYNSDASKDILLRSNLIFSGFRGGSANDMVL